MGNIPAPVQPADKNHESVRRPHTHVGCRGTEHLLCSTSLHVVEGTFLPLSVFGFHLTELEVIQQEGEAHCGLLVEAVCSDDAAYELL